METARCGPISNRGVHVRLSCDAPLFYSTQKREVDPPDVVESQDARLELGPLIDHDGAVPEDGVRLIDAEVEDPAQGGFAGHLMEDEVHLRPGTIAATEVGDNGGAGDGAKVIEEFGHSARLLEGNDSLQPGKRRGGENSWSGGAGASEDEEKARAGDGFHGDDGWTTATEECFRLVDGEAAQTNRK